MTEQDRAEDEIRKQANEILDLYQNAPCGYHSLDNQGRIVRINDTELAWLGYERDEVLGKPLTDFLTPDSQRQFERTFPLQRIYGGVHDIEQEMICKDGRILPVLLNTTAIFDDAGRLVMTRATITDMTTQKRAAEERQQQEARRLGLSQHLIELQEEERRRLAQELHDVVSPNIAAIKINLGIIELGLSRETLKHVGPRLADIRQLFQDTNRNLREICANLRPSLLDYAGLYAAVENYAGQFSERTGIRVEVSGGDVEDGRLPGNIEVLLFRIVQEALANCGKHAQATQMSIELSFDSQHAFLEISDNGVGFDMNELAAEGKRPGLGLLTMAERAELAGGRFQLESKPGQGTRITLEI